MIENPDFIALTAMEKVVYFAMLNDGNQNPDGWYKADIEYAVETRVGLDKIRRARRKFERLRWIVYKPGFRAKGADLRRMLREMTA